MAYTATAEIIPARPLALASSPTFSKDLFDRFIDYTDRKETTVKGYISCIRQFARWMEQNGIETPTRADIKAYRDHLKESDLAPGTQSQYLRAVKHFFKWTAAEGLFPNVADNVHGAKIRHDVHKKDAPQPEDVLRIESSIDRSNEQGKRLYAMLKLTVVCGLRDVEISRANVGDIKTIAGAKWLYLQGKGHDDKDQSVLLIKEVSDAINDYLAARTDKYTSKSPLFASTSNRHKGGRIAPTTISVIGKKMLVNAGYDSDRLTMHSLRHACGTGAHKAGIDLYGIQHLMRHQDPSTSEIYIHDDDHRAAEEKGRRAIYDYYFSGKTLNPVLPELASAVRELSPEEQRELLDYIKQIKKGTIDNE